MKSAFSPWNILTAMALLAAPAYLALTWAQLPAQIPTHFGLDGHANGFTAKADIWLLAVALPLGTFALLAALPYFDPKKRLDAGSANFQKLRLALVALVSGLAVYSLYVALHPGPNPGGGVTILLGGFFLLLGNYLTTVQPNYFVGLRTPWTLESPTVWARTHRLAGRLFVGVGLLSMVLGFVLPPEQSTLALVILVLGTAAVATAYSWFAFRQEARLA